MTQSVNLNANFYNKDISFGTLNSNASEANIFENNKSFSDYMSEDYVSKLEEELKNIQDNNGYKMNLWDKFKGAIGVGTSSVKCEESIEKFKKGELSFDDVLLEIEHYGNKQDSSLNLFANIATSFVAIGVATAASILSGGLTTPMLIAVGAGSGAIAKAGFKLTDRATNKVENDELNGKVIAKDMLTGALTGATAMATVGTGGSVYNSQATLAQNVINGAKNSAKIGLKAGSVSGAANYGIDCAFDENKDFNISGLVDSTVSNAVVSATVGALVGGGNGWLRAEGLLTAGGAPIAKDGNILHATAKDVIANGNCSLMHKVVNDRIRNA